jgi:hypothetical protein
LIYTVHINNNNKTDDNLNNTISLPSLLSPLSLSLDEVELSVTGMTDSGLVSGFTYSANPQRINMSNDDSSKTAQKQTNNTYNSKIKLVFEKDNIEKISQNEYTVMIKSSAPERIEQQQQSVENPLFVSLLFPIPVLLELPLSTIPNQRQVSDEDPIRIRDDSDNQLPSEGFFGIKDVSIISIIRTLSLTGAIGLVGYLIYTKVRRSKKDHREK